MFAIHHTQLPKEKIVRFKYIVHPQEMKIDFTYTIESPMILYNGNKFTSLFDCTNGIVAVGIQQRFPYKIENDRYTMITSHNNSVEYRFIKDVKTKHKSTWDRYDYNFMNVDEFMNSTPKSTYVKIKCSS